MSTISGQTAAGTTITLSGAASATTVASPTGAFSFTGLSNGSYVLTPFKQGFIFTPATSSQTITGTDITGLFFAVTPVGTSNSTFTLQNEVDKIKGLGDLETQFDVGGYTLEPIFTVANDIFNAICATSFPHKWNETSLPLFYTTSWQQDYALVNPDGTSVYNVEWLERGIAFDINNSAIPKPWVDVECGRSLPQRTGTYTNSGTQMNNPGFLVSSLPNESLYYGTWGAPNVGNPKLGNNPGPLSVYINPVGSSVQAASWSGSQAVFSLNYIPTGVAVSATMEVTGVTPIGYNGNWTVVSINDSVKTAPTVTVTMAVNPGIYQAGGIINNTASQSQPANPIIQIQDANGNLLVLTTYGAEGTTAPLAAQGAPAGTQVSGTGATTVWTVVDPLGLGIRILDVPSQTGVVWQFNLVGQMPPPIFTSINQTLYPLPDKYEPVFRAGLVAGLYQYSPIEKIRVKANEKWMMWLKSLESLRARQDRELEEYSFVPDRTVMGSGRRHNTFQGGAWPFNYPRP